MHDFIQITKQKLARAAAQIQALAQSISTWTAENTIKSECKLREGRLGFQVILQDFARPAPLDEWRHAFGECIHNLRSALDNLAFALARLQQDPPDNPKKIAFPIYQDKVEFQKHRAKLLAQLPVETAKVVESIQPFQRTDPAVPNTPDRDPLVLLQHFSNMDKHQIPSLVLVAPRSMDHFGGIEYHSNEDAAANVPPDMTLWFGPMKQGVVLVEWRTNRPIKSASGIESFRAIVAIETPNEPTGADVILMLKTLLDYTSLVVSAFDRFFEPQAVGPAQG